MHKFWSEIIFEYKTSCTIQILGKTWIDFSDLFFLKTRFYFRCEQWSVNRNILFLTFRNKWYLILYQYIPHLWQSEILGHLRIGRTLKGYKLSLVIWSNCVPIGTWYLVKSINLAIHLEFYCKLNTLLELSL